ncbi:MAG: hypothetical protein V1806_01240 [Pseudomonadota bacterium]
MNQVLEGIYLETKQTQVGTGHTASRVTFKNHYALRLVGEEALLFLLDDDLGLTGLREMVPLAQVGKRLEYQAQLQDTYTALLPKLGARPQATARPQPAPATAVQTRPPAQPPQTRPVAQPPQTRPVAQPPQTRPVAQPPQTRPVAQPPQTRPAAPPPAQKAGQQETPWWELTQKGASNLLKKD